MYKTKRYLPFSSRRYLISEIGEVIADDVVLPTYIIDDNICVDLEWINGSTSYIVAVLVIVAFSKINVPDYLFDKIIPLYIDGNYNNLSPGNLIYKFKNAPIEVENNKGFYYIPFSTNYAINNEGVIINIHTGKVKNWSITRSNDHTKTSGYHYTRVVTDEGYSKILFLHRAICLTFNDYDSNVTKMVINHKDGNPSNNNLNNLEICTYSHNNRHALENGLKNNNNIKPKPILVKNLASGNIVKYPTISSAARELNITPALISNRLNNSKNIRFADGLIFKYVDDDWPANVTDKISRFGNSSIILARNVFTKDVLIFSSTVTASVDTNVKSGTILSHLRNKTNIPVNGWLFKYKDEFTEWPEFDHKKLEIFKKYPMYPPNGCIVFNVETNEEIFFTSTSEAMNYFKLSKSIFFHYVNTEKLFNKKYLFKLFKIR